MARILVVNNSVVSGDCIADYLETTGGHIVVSRLSAQMAFLCADLYPFDVAVVDDLDLDTSGAIIAHQIKEELGKPVVGMKTLEGQPDFGDKTVIKGESGIALLVAIDELLEEAPVETEK
ncbi:MAG: hypothetical protein FJ044_02160 [Candidatus Cloacimonetes bacterium]|nr:hypothetical protein [Candidatus Cloacimonadota bacterium]